VSDPNNPTPELTPAQARLERLRNRFSDGQPGESSPSEQPDPSPAEPASEPKEESPVPTAAAEPTEAEPTVRQPKGTVAGKEKLQPYVSADIAERARNAWYRTRSLDDTFETFSDLIEVAIREKVEELEQRYNGGQPFTPRPRKRLSSGRPVGR
jgi:hypothetical protein